MIRIALCLAGAMAMLAQPPAAPTTAPPAAASSESPAPTAETAAPSDATLENRTTLNLLGATNAAAGESRRNENRNITLVDNNAAQELNQRVGSTATIVDEFQADQGYFSAEMGTPPRRPIHVRPQSGTGFHGNLFWNHDNSLFRARTFFQAGPVQPARTNQYGASAGLAPWHGAFLTLNASQNKIRGQVNGNVLIPLPSERTALATDSDTRAIVQRILDAYPNQAPNRPDIAARALNTNSPQTINTDTGSAQLTQRARARDTVSLQYAFTGQRIDAFQFIVGQNPNTATKSHSARISWNRAVSVRTVADVSAGFDRQGTLLTAAPGSLGPINTVGITGLGPQPNIPLDRAQNRFRLGLGLRQQRTHHTLTTGLALTRLQYNGSEPDAARGIVMIQPDFGRDAITNLRLGTPTRYIRTLGTFYRAFRNVDAQLYAGDRWQARDSLTINFDLRYEPIARPSEVTGQSHLPFDSDLNNAAGSFGFAYRLPSGHGVIRSAYGLMYGQIFPPTYGLDRLNLPYVVEINVQSPYLPDPLRGFNLADLGPNPRSSRYGISPELSTPYSHQYNFRWDGEVRGWRVTAGYAGSRSHKLFQTYITNRAVFVPGIDFNSTTVNLRRPNQNLYEDMLLHNGSRGYYDAGLASLTIPRWRGASVTASYWWSKAIDLGADYNNTGGGSGSGRRTAGQDGIDVHGDQRGLSDFDQPHSLLVRAAYDTPAARGRFGKLVTGWNLSTVVLVKNGTPFNVDGGSDAPGVGNVDGMGSDRPSVVDTAVLGRTVGNPDSSVALLPRAAFRFINAPTETRGNLGRNTFRKGKIANVNASLSRTFVLPHEWRALFRAQSVNFFNTPQFAEPGTSVAAPNFAQISNTLNDGRTFEFSLRLIF